MANYEKEAQKVYDETKEICDRFAKVAQKVFGNISPLTFKPRSEEVNQNGR